MSPEIELLYPALPPLLAIVLAVFLNWGAVIDKSVRDVCGRKNLSDESGNFIALVVRGALAVESFIVSVVAAILALALLVLSVEQRLGVANVQSVIFLALIILTILTYGWILNVVRVKDYDQVASDSVFVGKCELPFTYARLFQFVEIILNGVIIIVVVSFAFL